MEDSGTDILKAALFGVAVGDALGVPVEFTSRRQLDAFPVTDMRAYGTHGQPAGTWSDDSALTFCLVEMLCQPYDLQRLANRFVNWHDHGYWSAHGKVFDIGIATSQAIDRLRHGVDPPLAGGNDEGSNGNGSLMRILPLVFYLQDKPIAERFSMVRDVSSLTHRHIRSVIACFIYTEFALQLFQGKDKIAAYEAMRDLVNGFLLSEPICSTNELNKFHRILEKPVDHYDLIRLRDCMRGEIHSSGYVLSTLEASLWCILKTESYRDAVLMAVNLGEDTDTTGAVTGGLAGLLHGFNSIPEEWLQVIARKADIEDLANKLYNSLHP